MTTYLRGVSTREDWAWQPVKLERWPSKPRLGVKWHYPGAYRYRYNSHDICLQAVKSWDLYHRRRGSRMMEYSGLVCQHLFYIEGRSRWDDMMWRPASNGTVTLNTNHLGFQFLAGTQDTPPTDLEVAAMAEVTAQARQQGAGTDVLGHRDGYATACPGDALYRRLPDIRRIADEGIDDVPLTDAEKDDIAQRTARLVLRQMEWAHKAGEPALPLAAHVSRLRRQSDRLTAALNQPDEPDEPDPEPCDGYSVVSGDTLGKIADAHGVTLDALLDANPQITNPNVIEVGDCITIPKASTPTTG